VVFALLALAGRWIGLGAPYWAGLAAALLLVGWEFWICRRRERGPCFRAFLHNHWVGMAIFAGIAGHYALR
jgi:4-hydroxybenzoate polyprenyltransferase